MSSSSGAAPAAVPPGLAPKRAGLARAPIVYDRPKRRPTPQLQARDLEIMRALWRYRFFTTSQISEEWWAGRHPSRAQIRLAELCAAGLLARFRPVVKRGTHQWIYQLARDGFRVAQLSESLDGTYIDEQARWSERRAVDMGRVEHGLRVNGWLLTYRRLLDGKLLDWLGPREAKIDIAGDSDAGVAPDAGALVDLGSDAAPLEILIEVAREERPIRLSERFKRYDSLLSSSWPSIPRFRQTGRPPAILFIAEGYREVDKLLRAADQAVTTVLPATSQAPAVAPGRAGCLVCAEPDIYRGGLRAWMLPPKPPDERGSPRFTAAEVRLPT